MPYIKKGELFGRLLVTRGGSNVVRVRCVCGKRKPLKAEYLKYSGVSSCGCLHEISHYKHGLTKTYWYNAWMSIRQWCGNPKCRTYRWYGARGIKLFPPWEKS